MDHDDVVFTVEAEPACDEPTSGPLPEPTDAPSTSSSPTVSCPLMILFTLRCAQSFTTSIHSRNISIASSFLKAPTPEPTQAPTSSPTVS